VATTIPDPAAVRPPDRVKRDFTAGGPDELWVADFCSLRCWDGLVFFAFVIDVRSRTLVGRQFASHMRTTLVLDALRMALARRRSGAAVELVHHSDAGSQYTSYAFAQLLDDHGVLAWIGTVGDAYDNALAESFVDSFKTELIADRVRKTKTQLELAIVEYVGWFNHVRLHEALGDRPPAEFEQLQQAAISGNGSVAVLSPKPAQRIDAPRLERERASGTQTALSTTTDGRPASPASSPDRRKPTHPASAEPSPAQRGLVPIWSPPDPRRHPHDGKNVPICRGSLGGRYWARTSDLRLVEAALSQLS
jgi:putative transposase